MQIGLALPQYAAAGPLPWSVVVDTAERAEALGFASVWLVDQGVVGVHGDEGQPGAPTGLDPVVALSGLARRTTSVDLGLLVLGAPMRPPKLLVRQLETLQDIAGGRLIPGAWAGPDEPASGAAAAPLDAPGGRLRSLADLLDLLDAWGLPRLAAGEGDRFLSDVVVGHADGWMTTGTWTLAAYEARTAFLDTASRTAGRDPSTIRRSVGLDVLVGVDADDVGRRFRRIRERTPAAGTDATSFEEWKDGRLVGTVEEVRAQMARWRTLGISTLVVGLGALPFDSVDPDDLDLLASALL